MMTSTVITVTLTLLISLSAVMKGKNPAKMMMNILLLTTCMLFLYNNKLNSWFILIYFLLFAGGILIMFMLVVALTPNEKMKKAVEKKEFAKMSLISYTLWMFTKWKNMKMFEQEQLKSFMCNYNTLGALIMMMILYFCFFIYTLKTSNNSLRTYN